MLFGLINELNSLQIQVPIKANVWTTFGDLATKTGSCNLGQGFPDWETPSFVLSSLQQANKHQYTRPSGYPDLVSLLAHRYSVHLQHSVNPMTEVAITVGASQALYLSLTTMLKEDDEILMFDPHFELYAKQVALTKAKPVFVQLGQVGGTLDSDWALNVGKLRK